jgi:hypothetical protein
MKRKGKYGRKVGLIVKRYEKNGKKNKLKNKMIWKKWKKIS